ncbi:MAG: RimK family alpha-L-glutamate ligase [Candidatus Obscuribacterales bacterium]
MNRFCFLTSDQYPSLEKDYQPAIACLQAKGHTACVRVWNDREVDWSLFENLVIASIWDYHRDLGSFRTWLSERARQSNVINSIDLIEWNLNKLYLKELEEAGVPVIPTLWAERPEIAGCPWQKVVIKPAVGAGSFGMRAFDLNRQRDAAESHIAGLADRLPAMIQPELPSVSAEGEFVMVYFDGRFSHAAIRPLSGHQASVQDEIAAATLLEPEKEQLNIGGKVIECLPSKPCYARIDLVRDLENRYVVLEVELVEPSLFLKESPQAISAYTASLLAAAQQPAPNF